MNDIVINSYVTDKGGVVVLNGPFPIDKAKRVAALCDTAPKLLTIATKLLAESIPKLSSARPEATTKIGQIFADEAHAFIGKPPETHHEQILNRIPLWRNRLHRWYGGFRGRLDFVGKGLPLPELSKRCL